MKRYGLPVLILLGLAFSLAGRFSPVPAQAAPLRQSSTLQLVAPSSCPPGGCAAGQRLSYRLTFEIGVYRSDLSPNVKVCIYIPSSWLDAGSVQLDSTGGVTAQLYTPDASCAEDPAPPTDYSLAVAASAAMTGNFFNDILNLSFRISRLASSQGSVLMRVFERTSDAPDTWQRTSQTFTPQIQVQSRSTTAYIASDPSGCSAQPCYLNSAGDQSNGLGTGLRDAIEALDETQPNLQVTVLGAVGLRGNSVLVDKPVLIQGSGDAQLTVEPGAACTSGIPLLRFTNGGGLRTLNVSDGACSGGNDRPLVLVDSPAPVVIESNDLTGGSDAIRVTGGGGGNVLVRYNLIRGNSGFALFWDNTSAARLDLVANNLNGNRAGDPVECSAGAAAANPNRLADHNFWGGGAPGAGTHCAFSPGKHLGAPILALSGAPGLDARRVTVTGSKTYAFNNQIAYLRNGGSDFDLFIVNHGTNFPESQPFPGVAMPNPCSNAWDVFLAGGAPANTSLDLFFRYDRSSACIAAIETSTFCGQTTAPQNYPLWWLDPNGAITAGWDTTGQKPAGTGAGGVDGQPTACDLTQREIRVSIDTTGRPDLTNDLRFTPFLVGVPTPTTFQGFASDRTVTLVWTTIVEPDLTGFTVLRSQSAGGPFDPVSDLIPRRGSATFGANYSFADGGRTNGVISYYRLRMTRADGTTFLSDVLGVTPNIATATPTFTPIPTFTPLPTFTPFRLPTSVVQPSPTRAFTPTPFIIATQAFTPSNTPLIVFGTASPTPSGAYPGPDDTPAATQPGGTITPSPSLTATDGGTPTRTATASRTLAPTLSRAEQIRGASRFISLVMGLLISGVVVGGLTWLLFRKRENPPPPPE